MRRRLVLGAALGACATAGCSSVAPRPVRAAEYDLGPPPERAPARGIAAPRVLVLETVQASGPLEEAGMLYRLDYEDSRQLRAYTQSRWIAPIALLVRSRMAELLAPRFTVLTPGEAARRTRAASEGERFLRLELLDFSQRFDSPQSSVGEVRVRATVLRDGVVAQRTLAVREPALRADAAAGVRALSLGLERMAQQLGEWLDSGEH